MTMRSSWPARFGIHIVSGVVLGIGVAALIDAELGVAPYDVLTTGVAAFFGISVGVSLMACGAGLTVMAIVLGRRPSVGTIVALVVVGISVNVALATFTTPQTLRVQIVMAFFGAVATLIGITGTIVSEAGEGPIELFMLSVRDHRGWSVRSIRIGIEVTNVGVGWLLGGDVGIVTVLYALAIGPALHTSLARFE
ncbi:MAG TPA: hypothetical protein VMW08_07180 [Acidimicrobiales bacterium]|nr:hypothetical protein [Acidimicrobiales bacterium]